MEKQNLQLQKQILDDSNKAVMNEAKLRNDAELQVKQISLERDQLNRRVEEVQEQLKSLSEFKDKYIKQMEEEMAEYKIQMNKDYSSMLSKVEIEKAKVEGKSH